MNKEEEEEKNGVNVVVVAFLKYFKQTNDVVWYWLFYIATVEVEFSFFLIHFLEVYRFARCFFFIATHTHKRT